MKSKIYKAIKNPNLVLSKIISTKLFHGMNDKYYLKLKYRLRMGKKLNLSDPKTYNEKLQWLKLNDRNRFYCKLVDKYEVRKYIEDKIGEEYLVPIIGVYDNVEEIDFKSLPEQFVIKCTHDSGGVIICKDKNKVNINDIKNKISRSLKKNFYYNGREWVYKEVKPRIIIEKYMVDESGTQLKDYKFFCFNGTAKLMFICSDRGIATAFDFFDMDFNRIEMKQHYPNSTKHIKKPQAFEKMKELAEYLSQNIPHVRIDFYEINGKIYFGEFTFYHFSGFEKIQPDSFDRMLGEWIELV